MPCDPGSALQYWSTNKKLLLGVSLRLLSAAQGQVGVFLIPRFLSTEGVEMCFSCMIFFFMPDIKKRCPIPRIIDVSECWE